MARKKKEKPAIPPTHVSNGVAPPRAVQEEDLSIRALTRAEVASAAGFDMNQLASLVGMYEGIQKLRTSARNKEAAHERGADIQSPLPADLEDAFDLEEAEDPTQDPLLVTTLKNQLEKLEAQAERGMLSAVKGSPLGRWCLSLDGVGAVTAATLLSKIDFQRCCCEGYSHLRGSERDAIPPEHYRVCPGLVTVGHIWSFAGISGEKKTWEKGQIRPYCARLKTVLIKLMGDTLRRMTANPAKLSLSVEEVMDEIIADCKAKKKPVPDGEELLSKARHRIDWRNNAHEALNDESRLYVRLYRERKLQEVRRNEQGYFADRARWMLSEATRLGRKISPLQRETWASGRLQPAGLDLRAVRYAVKVFLQHFHMLGREYHYGDVVKPWVLVHDPKHSHFIPPPNLHVWREELARQKSLQEGRRGGQSK